MVIMSPSKSLILWEERTFFRSFNNNQTGLYKHARNGRRYREAIQNTRINNRKSFDLEELACRQTEKFFGGSWRMRSRGAHPRRGDCPNFGPDFSATSITRRNTHA